jgi:hypothetical protein
MHGKKESPFSKIFLHAKNDVKECSLEMKLDELRENLKPVFRIYVSRGVNLDPQIHYSGYGSDPTLTTLQEKL